MYGGRTYTPDESLANQSKLLVVDDSEDDCYLLLDALEKFPLVRTVAVLDDGIEAIYYLSGAGDYGDRSRFPYPDVVLLDLQMPVVNGFQILESITAEDRSHPRVIVISGTNESASSHEALRLGASLYLTKNGNFSELARQVAEFLSTGSVHSAPL